MRLQARVSALWRSCLQRRRMNQELDEELRFHLEQQVRANLAAGMAAEQAQRQARLVFGGLESVKDDCRDQWSSRLLDSTARDLRYAVRGFRRNPVFTLAVLCTLALGIGATTAVFSVVDRILFRPLPYGRADRLVSVGITAPIENNEFMLGANYAFWREARLPFQSITSLTAFTSAMAACDLTEPHPLRMSCLQVESNFLSTLGVRPVAGQDFTPADDRPNAPPVALISYGLWRSRFGGDPAAAGKLISLDGKPVRVAGVLPRNFEMPTLTPADILLPQRMDWNQQKSQPTGRVLRCFARLKPGITLEQARAQLQPLFADLLKTTPPQFRNEIHLALRPLRDREMGNALLAAWVLLGAVLAVLLIASANVANLLLARAAARQRELAMRAALGASRARLARQALSESLALALSGGLAGCVLGWGLLRLFVSLAPQGLPRLQAAGLDQRVLLFTLAISVVCGVAFGMAPALHRAPPQAALAGARASAAHGYLRQALVVAQVAISLVLLAGASLLSRSLWNLQNQPLGLRADSLLLGELSLGQSRYAQPQQQLAFFDELETRLRRLPGITALALSDSLPPGGWQHFHIFAAIAVRGRARFRQGTGGDVTWRAITPGYFAALGIPMVRGRGFTDGDRQPGQHAVILSRELAERLFPGQDALGQQLQFGEGPWYSVIGVAADVKNGGLAAAPDPEYYVVRHHAAAAGDDPRGQVDPHAYIIVRTPMKPAAMAQWVRAEVAGLDPTLPVQMDTMEQRVSQMEARPRFDAALLGLFAALGVLLAAIGIYGVIAFLVTQRTQEIGVRMALGARRGDVLRLVAGKGLGLVAAGGGAGMAAALALSRLLRGLLFGVGPYDAAALCAAAGLLFAVAVLAICIPARAATRIDPMVALRWE
jgi:predicted permease